MYEYKLIRSKRKSISLEISKNLDIIVRSPYDFPKSEIDRFVTSKNDWITKNLEKMKTKTEKYPSQVSEDEAKSLIEKAKKILPDKVAYYSKLMNLYPTALKITAAKTRFGSCSGKDSICFSYLLMRYPDEAIDYVVVHELAHIKHKNHSKAFYALIEKYLPNYKEREKLLK
ncbi:M48 family metallopeptidase [Pseudoruminococcus massiliensis]|uniref:M48 family metallopeptidase n=1 Tax=Pseudoruminococcus massiliensis TaxID=2086583 RepID=UPI00402A000F